MAIQPDPPQQRARRRRFRPPAPPLPAGGCQPDPSAAPTPEGQDGSVAWLEPAMAANGIGAFDWDIRRDRLDGDLRAFHILGLDPDEQSDRSSTAFLSLLHPDDAAVVRRRVARAVLDLGQCGAYYRAVTRDGALRAVRFRGRVLADPDGRASRMVGFVWDATAELHKRDRDDQLARLREERTRFVKEAARRLSEAVTVPDVARVFTELPLPGIPPDGMVLFTVDGGRLTLLDSSGYDEAVLRPYLRLPIHPGGAPEAGGRRREAGAEPPADSPAALAVRSRAPVFIPSRADYAERFPAAWAALSGEGPADEAPGRSDTPRNAWAYLPLVASGRAIGVCVVSFDDDRELDAEDRTLLTTLGGMVAQSLARARLHDAEHELAAGLQRVLLPRRVPPTPGVSTAVRYLPAGSGLQIGGDWYDVVPLPGGHVGLVIGDVQGHDVAAAGVMGQLRIAMRAYAAEGHPPAAVMARASRFLADLDTGYFATCTYLEVNIDFGAVYAVRAGHLDPVVRRADGSCAIQPVAGGLPLGVAPEEEYPVTRFTLDPGELLALCTDGLVESRTVELDRGMEQLRSVLAEHGADATGGAQRGEPGREGLEALADRVLGVGQSHSQDDDIALLLFRWDGPSDGRPRRMLRRRVAQADLARIASVRAELVDAVRRWGVGELADSAELLASELLTNALVHTDRDALLTARLYGCAANGGGSAGSALPVPVRLRVEVEDESDQWPKRRTPGEQASSGRGLLLVEALADDWGVDPRGVGKRMWFELVAPAGATAGAGD